MRKIKIFINISRFIIYLYVHYVRKFESNYIFIWNKKFFINNYENNLFIIDLLKLIISLDKEKLIDKIFFKIYVKIMKKKKIIIFMNQKFDFNFIYLIFRYYIYIFYYTSINSNKFLQIFWITIYLRRRLIS